MPLAAPVSTQSTTTTTTISTLPLYLSSVSSPSTSSSRFPRSINTTRPTSGDSFATSSGYSVPLARDGSDDGSSSSFKATAARKRSSGMWGFNGNAIGGAATAGKPVIPPKPSLLNNGGALSRERAATLDALPDTSELLVTTDHPVQEDEEDLDDFAPSPAHHPKPFYSFPSKFSPRKPQTSHGAPPIRGRVSSSPLTNPSSSSHAPNASGSGSAATRVVGPTLGALKSGLVGGWARARHMHANAVAARLPSSNSNALLASSSAATSNWNSVEESSSRSSTSSTTILGVRVPKRSGVVFGEALSDAVERTRLRDWEKLHRPKSEDPVTGDEARKWLPAVAFRCLEYLEEWGVKEEGVYRIPGSSGQIAQLRTLFDAGCDLDLREIHPGDLDPHAVGSVFKSWLRETPDPLLSSVLAEPVDSLLTRYTGYSSLTSSYLGSAPSSPLIGSGMINNRAPREMLDRIADLFERQMPAEEYHLLKALSYHLARLAAASERNKMTLGNLRLILAPTVRLSPVMLLILVEERDVLFGRGNLSSKLRDPHLAYHPSPLLRAPSPQGPSTTPNASPLVQQVEAPPRSPTSPSGSSKTTTPIADKFTFSPNIPPLSPITINTSFPRSPSPARSSASSLVSPVQFIPTRNRVASDKSNFFANAERPRKISLADALAEQNQSRPGMHTRASSKGVTEVLNSEKMERRNSWKSWRASMRVEVGRNSCDTMDSGRPSIAGSRTASSSRESSSGQSAGPPQLGLGLGLGLKGDERDSWGGLLSVEDRRKFFEGVHTP